MPASRLKAWHLALLVLFVVLLRAPFFGSPAIHIDEQFYLVVADRWVHAGAIPYVDIWDRKPIGLFAIYAVATLLFGDPIIGYQLLATAFAAATCVLIVFMGQRIASLRVGILAALVYAVSLSLMEGGGGQAPVFHNLLIAAGAFVAMRAVAGERVLALSAAACLLFGIGLQIKYTCALEAIAISLYLLIMQRGFDLPRKLGIALLMMLCGAAPTLLAGAVYAHFGHWSEFYDANFASIFHKDIWRLSLLEYLWRFAKSMLFCIPFLPFAGVAIARVDRRDHAWNIVILWLIAASVGAMLIGSPNRLYFLPALVPLALLTSRGFEQILSERPQLGFARVTAAYLALPVVAAFVVAYTTQLQRGERADVYALGDYLRARNSDGCLFVFNRLPVLYYLSGACAPSKYLFPNHLSEVSEVRGSGSQGLAELRRVLATKPAMVFERLPTSEDLDPEAIAIFQKAMQENYTVGLERQGYQQTYRVYIPKPSPQTQ